DYSEGSKLPEESTVGESAVERIEQKKEIANESPPEQAQESPFVVDERRSKEKQEKTRPKTKSIANKQDGDSRKIFDHFMKHFQASKIASDKTTNMLKQIQKQLVQVEKLGAGSNKQQAVIKQLASQVKIIQKQLDKIAGSIDRIKSIPIGKRKKK